RALWEIRQALGRNDILISDVGLHKLWIGRMFPTYEPNTVLIANGLAGMGFAVPAAIAAKLVHPKRNVISVNGDGGFLMNCQELETAVRLKTPFVSVVWENQQFGSIVWKQDKSGEERAGAEGHRERAKAALHRRPMARRRRGCDLAGGGSGDRRDVVRGRRRDTRRRGCGAGRGGGQAGGVGRDAAARARGDP